MSGAVVLPAMPEAAEQSWLGLLDVADAVPDRWALVGGQMVHLLCWERGRPPRRVTTDNDVVIDVRAWPHAAHDVTSVLRDLGFTTAGETWNGRQYRWVRGRAQIDVLIPRHLGERAENRRGVTGGTLLPSPGAASGLSRSEPVAVRIAGREAVVLRPSLLGALILKASAYTEIHDDRGRARHLDDFVLLASMLERRDMVQPAVSRLEARRLTAMIAIAQRAGAVLATIDGAEAGVERLHASLDRRG